MKSKPTPTQAARMYLIRTFGDFIITMPQASQNQLVAAYVAGVRHGQNGHRRTK